MALCPVRKPRFKQPQYFEYIEDLDKWTCNACFPNSKVARRKSMIESAIKRHERTDSHKEKVQAVERWQPEPDLEAWLDTEEPNADSQLSVFDNKFFSRMHRVDQLTEAIPFWREQIEAAEHGVTLRFEDFLDELQRMRDQQIQWVDWTAPMPDWGKDLLSAGVGHRSSETVQDQEEQRSISESEAMRAAEEGDLLKSVSETGSAYDFVEKYAKKNLADAEKKDQMHTFYKIPTSEKVERIQELLAQLRT